MPPVVRPIYPGWHGHRPGYQDNHFWRRYRRPSAYIYPAGFFAFAWGIGQALPAAWYDREYQIYDPVRYGLPRPYAGFSWVRVKDDVVLVQLGSGRIYEVRRSWFY